MCSLGRLGAHVHQLNERPIERSEKRSAFNEQLLCQQQTQCIKEITRVQEEAETYGSLPSSDRRLSSSMFPLFPRWIGVIPKNDKRRRFAQRNLGNGHCESRMPQASFHHVSTGFLEGRSKMRRWASQAIGPRSFPHDRGGKAVCEESDDTWLAPGDPPDNCFSFRAKPEWTWMQYAASVQNRDFRSQSALPSLRSW